nr:hypothetical protein PHYPA_019745 [Ipomoea batatas]
MALSDERLGVFCWEVKVLGTRGWSAQLLDEFLIPPVEIRIGIDFCKVHIKLSLNCRSTDLEHPGSGIISLSDFRNPRHRLEILYQPVRVMTKRPRVDHLPSPLHQQKLVKCFKDIYAWLVNCADDGSSCIHSVSDSSHHDCSSSSVEA